MFDFVKIFNLIYLIFKLRQKQNEQAQAKIISLTEELQQAKEYVQQLMDLEKNLLES